MKQSWPVVHGPMPNTTGTQPVSGSVLPNRMEGGGGQSLQGQVALCWVKSKEMRMCLFLSEFFWAWKQDELDEFKMTLFYKDKRPCSSLRKSPNSVIR